VRPELEALSSEIKQAFADRARPGATLATDRYETGSESSGYNLRSPQFYAVLKTFQPAFKRMTVDDRLVLAAALLRSGNHELIVTAIRLMALSLPWLLPAQRDFMVGVPEYFHGWGATDDFCINVLHPLLLRQPWDVLPLLEEWNHSTNPWARRASVVAFTRKVGASGRFTRECLRLCENLVWDTHDLVRKGVGWALKDTLRGDRVAVLAYIRGLRRRGVSAVITLYAIRDLKGQQRAEILAIHKL
jgi:hypothetical protein